MVGKNELIAGIAALALVGLWKSGSLPKFDSPSFDASVFTNRAKSEAAKARVSVHNARLQRQIDPLVEVRNKARSELTSYPIRPITLDRSTANFLYKGGARPTPSVYQAFLQNEEHKKQRSTINAFIGETDQQIALLESQKLDNHGI